MSLDTTPISARDYVLPLGGAQRGEGGHSTYYARLQNSLIAWTDATSGTAIEQECEDESFVIFPDVGGRLCGGGMEVDAPARSICILPPGPARISLQGAGRIVRVFSPAPAHMAQQAMNAGGYDACRPEVRPIGTSMIRTRPAGVRVFPIETYKPIAGKRPPTFQTGTMNVMWIEQNGGASGKLNPHEHEDFEEGALVLFGDYVEHLRTPWTPNRTEWREDLHATCGPGSLFVIPPRVIHATEACGPGPHVMLNIFAPAREDHIASGMVLNALDYRRQ